MVFDLETETRELFGRKASPWHPENSIVAIGYTNIANEDKYPKDKDIHAHVNTSHINDKCCITWEDHMSIFFKALEDYELLVGFNIRFDLLWIWHDERLQNWIKKGGKIWDCQQVEYLLSGQSHLYPSLNDTAKAYGLGTKIDVIKKMWDKGMQTSEIDPLLLCDYLKQDVHLTEQVYLAQLEELQQLPNMFKLIPLISDSLLATCEMEYQGMHVDADNAAMLKSRLDQEIHTLDQELTLLFNDYLRDLPEEDRNPNSLKQLAAIIFGGELSYFEKLPTGIVQKNGKPQIRKTEVIIKLPGLGVLPSEVGSEKTMNDGWKLDDDVMDKMQYCSSERASNLAYLLRRYRKLNKLLMTYVVPSIHQQIDGVIHGQIKHCSTVTGRLSASNPNLQNIPRLSEEFGIRSMFSSRFKSGKIINLDYSNLEVVAAAFLSQDTQMLSDLRDGIDMHRLNASKIFHIPEAQVTKDQRQRAKVASFQLLYGSGAENMGNVIFDGDQSLAEGFMQAYYDRYWELKEWHKDAIESSKEMLHKPVYIKESCTGRLYKFKRLYNEEKGAYFFMPTQLKNYPVQGFATADIVPIMCGILYRKLLQYDKSLCKLINTVHDSVMIDCDDSLVDEVSKTAKEVLESVADMFLNTYGIDFNVPIKVDVTANKYWS